MVHEVSGHDAEFIMKKMAYSKGLHFRTLFWQARGYEVESITDRQESPLNKKL